MDSIEILIEKYKEFLSTHFARGRFIFSPGDTIGRFVQDPTFNDFMEWLVSKKNEKGNTEN